MVYSVSSNGKPETRTQILEAARGMFEELGYYGAGLGAVAKKAGVSRQAIYLHFPSKAELLTALHLHIFATDVLPVVERHPITDEMTALDALDTMIGVDVEVVSKVWRIHEALTTARRQHPEVEETLRPREDDRYGELLDRARRLKKVGGLPPKMRPGAFADMLWGLVSVGTYTSLVNERGWSLDQYRRWVRDTVRLHIRAGDG
jgi:AcrR family transcriptional regulator